MVPYGVDAEWFTPVDAPDPAATLARHGLHQGYYLFVGTLQPRKNIERVLDAWESLAERLRRARQLVIVGAPGWRCEQLVARLLAARQNGAQVVWLDQVADGASLRALYAGAGVFVFASLYEGFGLPVLEAFAAGVPVLASNSSSLPKWRAMPPCWSTCSRRLAEAVRHAAQDSVARTRCIAAGRARATN